MHRAICLFHYYVYRFEHFFSRSPLALLRKKSSHESFVYNYDIALNCRFSMPAKATAVFRSLLNQLIEADFDEVWSLDRQARINYYLGVLAEDEAEKISYLKRCQVLMPNHYASRELLFDLARGKDI